MLIVVAALAVVGCKKKEVTGGDPGSGSTKTEPSKGEPPAPATAHPSEDDCKKLQAHIFEITPDSAAKLKAMADDAARKAATNEFVTAVPPEDIKQCTEGAKSVIDCMQGAADLDKLKACIPN